MLYAFFDYIPYGAKFLTENSLIFEFQRYHKEPWLMVCNFVSKLRKNSHFLYYGRKFGVFVMFMSSIYNVTLLIFIHCTF